MFSPSKGTVLDPSLFSSHQVSYTFYPIQMSIKFMAENVLGLSLNKVSLGRILETGTWKYRFLFRGVNKQI